MKKRKPGPIIPNPNEEELAMQVEQEINEVKTLEEMNKEGDFHDELKEVLSEVGVTEEKSVFLGKKTFGAGEFPGDTMRNFQEIIAELKLDPDGVYEFRSAREIIEGVPTVTTNVYGKASSKV